MNDVIGAVGASDGLGMGWFSLLEQQAKAPVNDEGARQRLRRPVARSARRSLVFAKAEESHQHDRCLNAHGPLARRKRLRRGRLR